jgi:AmmeMemoRadiSam system protein B
MHLPFIKKVFSNRNDIKLVPILVGNLTKDKEQYYGKLLAKYLNQDKDQDNLFIVSSDFCHWGSSFDYVFIREHNNKNKSISE